MTRPAASPSASPSGSPSGSASAHPSPAPGWAAPTLTESAYARLEEMIVTLDLAPGSVVSEAILGRLLGIGTTPVREALQRLAREHLVQVLPRRGVVVTGVDLHQQLHVLETRRELDRLIARAAARRARPAERAALAALAAGMTEAARIQDARGFLRLDGQLSQALAEAARNPVAAACVASLHAVARRFWFYHHSAEEELTETAALHVAVAGAVAEGQEAMAAEASDRLIAQMIRLARRTVPELDPETGPTA
ncbi:GntR family transcriptional regulator [Falsiroseomonas tokyonensis]|uniref:GntR family transcriptional regulator n=1 Tax=Falsiroseomonas tokyonensis TaxID=430521 RepID=A0ABV7BTN8_9PROT|nr:GntR family transcriptional regulator [Falsiroseomonas tokyonensis]MBU8539011.1 GntR family transcriptional regulator [Falsiroseomonas tokyonensis]